VSAGWVAGSVRAKAMARRRIGAAHLRALAGRPTLAEALTEIADGPYGHDVRADQSLAEAQHAITAATLWNVRVLAGWLPPRGGELLRLLAGWFEIANVDEHVRELTGEPAAPRYRLGTLATAWPRLSQAGSLAELRVALAASPWGDPGGDTPRLLALGPRLAWARRVAALVPFTEPWAAGGTALLVARERFGAGGRGLPEPAAAAASLLLGNAWRAATSPAELAGRLPATARWAVAGVLSGADLWRAEAGWWSRIRADGRRLLASARFGPGPAVGAVALLAVDAWQAQVALELAARGGGDLEVFDAVA
jgi:hypothetical protein